MVAEEEVPLALVGVLVGVVERVVVMVDGQYLFFVRYTEESMYVKGWVVKQNVHVYDD